MAKPAWLASAQKNPGAVEALPCSKALGFAPALSNHRTILQGQAGTPRRGNASDNRSVFRVTGGAMTSARGAPPFAALRAEEENQACPVSGKHGSCPVSGHAPVSEPFTAGKSSAGGGASARAPCPYTEALMSPKAPKQSGVESITDREGFVRFVLAATNSRRTPQYRHLYSLLLRCFTEADTDFDGLVGPDAFDLMVEQAGALPRKFGFEWFPTSAEAFPTADARRRHRADMFREIDSSGDGKIAFDEWLNFTYDHICEKAQLLNLEDSRRKLGTFSPDGFFKFVQMVVGSKSSVEYMEMYRWLLKCFVSADKDRDGRINCKEFDALVDDAAKEPRRLGFAKAADEIYKSEIERHAARRTMFNTMDKDRSRFIGFDEFLSFTMDHIRHKVGLMPAELPRELSNRVCPMQANVHVRPEVDLLPTDKQMFVKFVVSATSSRKTSEFRQLYTFLLDCFTEADADLDGLVGPDEFDIMVERAGALPRKFGFAPTEAEAFPSADIRRAHRREMFRKMDVSGDGQIAFDEWLEFCYGHICNKVRLINPFDTQWKLGTFGQEGFLNFLQAACWSKTSMEFKELYHWLLRCFTDADRDGDGRVVREEFDELVELSASEPRRLGFAPHSSKVYKTSSEKQSARDEMFSQMDEDGGGSVGFDEYLAFTVEHIRDKVKAVMAAGGRAPQRRA